MMKEIYEKIKEKLGNKYIKSALFFGFYAIFFLIVFGIFSAYGVNSKKDIKKEIIDKWVYLDNNYEYLYQIDFKDSAGKSVDVTLQGKRYNNKELFNKYVNRELDSLVYTFYNNVSVKKDNKWIAQNDFVKIYPGFDDKLINLTYIKDIINDSVLVLSKPNDINPNAIDEEYLYSTGINITVTSEENIISVIRIKTSNVDISLQYDNINKVKDFVIDDKGK